MNPHFKNVKQVFAQGLARSTAVLAVMSVVANCWLAADWPQWLGPTRNGTSSLKVAAWKGDLPVLWRQPVGEGHSGPVVAAGRVFLHVKVAGREQEEVLAFDLQTGKPVWRQTYDRPKFESAFGNGPRATPLVSPTGHLITYGASGTLCAWEAATGKLLWRKDVLEEFGAKNLLFGVSSSPLLTTGKRRLVVVLVGGSKGSVVAFDLASGEAVWKSGSDPASYSSPVLAEIAGRQVLVVLTARHLAAVDPTTGIWLASYPFVDKLNETAITPVVIGDRVFVSSITAGSVLLRLRHQDDRFDWQELWKNNQLNCYFATPVAFGELLFVVHNRLLPPSASLNCLALGDGQLLWKSPTNTAVVGKYHATLLRAADKLLVLKEDGELLLMEPNATTLKVLARARVCANTWAHPAFADHFLIVRDERELLCLRLPQP